MMPDFNKEINREGTSSVKYDFRGEFFGRADVIPMWVADMDLPVPEAVTEALRNRTSHPVYGYSIIGDSYYEAFINWEHRRHNWKIAKDWVSFSPGIVTALNVIVRSLSEPGDSIIVQPPVYFPFFSAVKENGRRLVYNQLKEEDGYYTIDFEDLEAKLREGAKMLILCNPHNPVGRSWTKEELRTLGELCLEYNTLVVSDEIHCDLVFHPNVHTPLAVVSPELENQTITCLSPSKSFNLAGLFTSQVVIPNDQIRKAFSEEMGKLHLGPNIFGIVASEAAYSQGGEWLSKLMEYLWENYLFVKGYLEKNFQVVKLSPLESTYLLWLDFRSLSLSDKELKKLMIEKAGIGMNDGPMFGPGGKGFQRMNIACPRSVIERALEGLKGVF